MYTMGIQIAHKLNRLQHILPEGLVVNAPWLQKEGYSRGLIAKYVQNGWLQSPARGIYRRPSSHLPVGGPDVWEAAVVSMQQLLDVLITPGGRTALELQGYGHYISTDGPINIELYGPPSPPAWILKFPLEHTLKLHPNVLFQTNSESTNEKLSSVWHVASGRFNNEHAQIHYTNKPWGAYGWPLLMSTPERAALELLAEVPQRETFEQADALLDGLTNLSPKRLNTLLMECRSIKVKRLFMWFGERHNHPWFSKLDKDRINLGSGKRAIVPGGKLDKKYLITVPRDLTTYG
jgi:hypothetical protein